MEASPVAELPMGVSPGKDMEFLRIARQGEIQACIQTHDCSTAISTPVPASHTNSPKPEETPLPLKEMVSPQRLSGGGQRKSTGDNSKENKPQTSNEFLQKLSRRRFHCDEAGKEFVKERDLENAPDMSFYVHHESQFTPRGTKATLPDWSAELAEREERVKEREADLGTREAKLTADSERLAESMDLLAEKESTLSAREEHLEQEWQRHSDEDAARRKQAQLFVERDSALRAEKESLTVLRNELEEKGKRTTRRGCCSRLGGLLCWIGNALLRFAIRSFILYILLMPSWPDLASYPEQFVSQLADAVGHNAATQETAAAACPSPVRCPVCPGCPAFAQKQRAIRFKTQPHLKWAIWANSSAAVMDTWACLPDEAVRGHLAIQQSLVELQQLKDEDPAGQRRANKRCICPKHEAVIQQVQLPQAMAQPPQQQLASQHLAPEQLQQQPLTMSQSLQGSLPPSPPLPPSYQEPQQLKEFGAERELQSEPQQAEHGSARWVMFVGAAMAVKELARMALAF